VGIDPVIAASVQTQKDYTWRDVRFGERFVEIYTDHGGGRLSVDYGRIHETEPAGGVGILVSRDGQIDNGLEAVP